MCVDLRNRHRGGNGEQQTLRNAFPERYAVVTGRRTAAPEDVSNASTSARRIAQRLTACPTSRLQVAAHARTQ